MAHREKPEFAGEKEGDQRPKHAEPYHGKVKRIDQLPRGNCGDKPKRQHEGEKPLHASLVDVHRIPGHLHDRLTQYPKVLHSDEPDPGGHEEEIERVKQRTRAD